MRHLDDQDRRLLRQLQADALASTGEIAKRAGLSPAQATRRLERMEADGLIEGYSTVINWAALGYALSVSLRVTLDKTVPTAFDEFLSAARQIAEVEEIQTFLGRVDVRLNVIARDMAHYQEIYRTKILGLPHISDIEALMLVSEVKNIEALPL